jgi:hypothetical protein
VAVPVAVSVLVLPVAFPLLLVVLEVLLVLVVVSAAVLSVAVVVAVVVELSAVVAPLAVPDVVAVCAGVLAVEPLPPPHAPSERALSKAAHSARWRLPPELADGRPWRTKREKYMVCLKFLSWNIDYMQY